MKTFRRILIGLLIVGIISFAALQGLIVSTHETNQSDEARPVVIVLGAKLKGDQPMLALQYRLETALAYLNQHPESLVICTGAQGADELISEAQAMKNWLEKKGISTARILIEEQSRNTFENFLQAKRLLEEQGLPNQVAIATSGYHLFRAQMLAKRVGLDPILLAAKTPKVIVFQSYIREALAIVKSYFLDR